MRIVVADDSRAMRSVYRQVLAKIGYSSGEIQDAQDWSETRAALKQSGEAVDVLIYDWDLPGLDGSVLMPALKDMGLSGRTTVLFCVSRSQRGLVSQISRYGAFDYIERPFTDEAFAAKIRGLGPSLEPKKLSSSRNLPAVPAKPEPERTPPFLTQLDAGTRSELLKLSTVGRYEPGTVLLRPGQRCESLHVVTRGEVEILVGAQGKRARVVEAGDPFGELFFLTSQPSAETARALTRVETASLSKGRVSDLLRARPTFAPFLTSLMNRHKKAMTARATTLEHSDFKGTFDTFPFADVMQMLISTRKTGVLGLRQDMDRGAIYLEDGEAHHAWTDTLQGEAAFLELAKWTTSKFAFTSIQRKEPRTLPSPTITLLMKAMRQGEEAAAPAPAGDMSLDDLFKPKT